MKIIQAATLETELARREVLRCFKNIKKAIEDFKQEAKGSKAYSKNQAIEAFKCIDYEVEKQTVKWLAQDTENKSWDEV